MLLEADVDVLYGGRAVSGLDGVEGVQAADDDARLADVADVHDLGVLQDRPLGDELAVLDAHGGDLHGHAGIQARGQAGADLEAEQAASKSAYLKPLSAITLAMASTTGWASPSGPLTR